MIGTNEIGIYRKEIDKRVIGTRRDTANEKESEQECAKGKGARGKDEREQREVATEREMQEN